MPLASNLSMLAEIWDLSILIRVSYNICILCLEPKLLELIFTCGIRFKLIFLAYGYSVITILFAKNIVPQRIVSAFLSRRIWPHSSYFWTLFIFIDTCVRK